MEFGKAKNLSIKAFSYFLKTLLCVFVYFFFAFTVPDLISNLLKEGQKVIHAADENVIIFDEVVITIEKVSEPEEQQIGLSKYSSLPQKNGMLFVFDESDFHSFWMKDMKFPIDIVWLDETLRVVDIKRKIHPDSYPTSFVPTEKAKYVLEVNAGFIDKNFIKLGDQATFFKKP